MGRALWVLVVLARVAHADPAPRDPAWALYDRAFEDLGRGETHDARAKLQQLVVLYPKHPASAVAAVRLSELDGALQARAAAAAAAPSQLARGELVFWTTAGGAYIATNLCIDRCYTDRDAATVFTLTMGGALAISALASSHVHQGQAQLYNSAQV